MGLFGFGKRRNEVIDLAERYRQQKERESMGETSEVPSETETIDLSQPHEKRKKLAKRILDMTNKLDELSNQVYLLQQRIEVLERKIGVGNQNISSPDPSFSQDNTGTETGNP